MQDDLVWEDWEGADYAAHGLTPPDRFYTDEEKKGMVGGTQGQSGEPLAAGIEPLTEDGFRATLTPGLPPCERKYRCRMPYGKWGGVWPHNFPAGYDDHILDMTIHPQMLQIHHLMMGAGPIRFDHNMSLNRVAPFHGQFWHSHPYVEDNLGPTTRPPQLGLVRTLAYPEGFAAEDDGGV